MICAQALRSLRSIAPLDNTLVMTLEREVESLQTERREVDSWINQAETWAAHMGQWKATVMLPQVTILHELLFNHYYLIYLNFNYYLIII